jgi:hypothetical protein
LKPLHETHDSGLKPLHSDAHGRDARATKIASK